MKLTLGTVQFGLPYGIAGNESKVSKTEVEAILALANKHGIDTLDTAVLYGESEAILGSIGVRGWQVVTKLPTIPDHVDVSKWIRQQVTESLSRLCITELSGLLLHRPEQLLVKGIRKEIVSTLCDLKSNGIVEKIGISIYGPEELDHLSNFMDFDIVQAPFSVIDRRMLKSGWLEKLKNNDVEFHARSIFLQGLLLQSKEMQANKFGSWQALWDTWDKWLLDNKVTPLETCLRYPLSFDEIDKVVVGVDNVTQFSEIISATNGEVPIIPDALYTNDVNLLNPTYW